MICVGDYVIYVKNGNINTIGQTKKDIWRVVKTGTFERGFTVCEVESLSKPGKIFDSSDYNFININEVLRKGLLKPENFIEKAYMKAKGEVYNSFKQEFESKGNFKKEFVGDTMNKENMVKRTVDSNVDAAKAAAKITAGMTLNKLVSTQLRDRKVLPVMVRGYADTAVGAVVIANIADFAVKQFLPHNKKAVLATDAMMQAAMVDLMAEFDFEGIINDLVANVSLDALDD